MTIGNLSEIPSEPHWAIMTQETNYIPGDERSRTNPGHGYHSRTVTSFSYSVYMDEEEWRKDIEDRTLRGSSYSRNFVAFKSSGRAEVESRTTVTVNKT